MEGFNSPTNVALVGQSNLPWINCPSSSLTDNGNSGLKQPVAIRLKGPGMHWTAAGSVAVTALRAHKLNDHWRSLGMTCEIPVQRHTPSSTNHRTNFNARFRVLRPPRRTTVANPFAFRPRVPHIGGAKSKLSIRRLDQTKCRECIHNCIHNRRKTVALGGIRGRIAALASGRRFAASQVKMATCG